MGQNTLGDHMHIQSIRSRHRACNIFPPLLVLMDKVMLTSSPAPRTLVSSPEACPPALGVPSVVVQVGRALSGHGRRPCEASELESALLLGPGGAASRHSAIPAKTRSTGCTCFRVPKYSSRALLLPQPPFGWGLYGLAFDILADAHVSALLAASEPPPPPCGGGCVPLWPHAHRRSRLLPDPPSDWPLRRFACGQRQHDGSLCANHVPGAGPRRTDSTHRRPDCTVEG